ncbi:MAG TPA: hypothetical protein VGB77_02600 [Abditibacteriaceae bacterium]|jgi:hypothetical protein
MADRGSRVHVNLRNGDVVDGWVYGESLLGKYIALDPNAEIIRFIPDGTWQSAHYDHSNPARFNSIIDNQYTSPVRGIRASESLRNRAANALDKVDYNRVRRIHAKFETLQDQFYGPYDSMAFQEHRLEDEQHTLLDVALELRSTYSELVEEVRRSGLSDVLLEDAEEIQQFISNEGLPIMDYWMLREMRHRDEAFFLLESMIYLARHTNLLAETNLGTYPLQGLDPGRIARHIDEQEAETQQEEESSPWPKRLKMTAAIGKVAVGGSLAAANICAGAFAGVVSALPTLGVGTVAGAVGVATSTYTGLNAACDGLKDLATAIESK